MKTLFKKLTFGVGLLLAVSTVSLLAQITVIPSPFGGNDVGSFQSFGVINTVVGGTAYLRTGAAYYTNSSVIIGYTNVTTTGPLGGMVDVSAFEDATIVATVTNFYPTIATNMFTVLKGYGAGPITSFETTPSLPTYTVVVPANSYVCWMTNLTASDLAGVGYLEIGSLTNISVSATNGYYAVGATNVLGLSTNSLGVVTGTTNITGYAFQIGVATKVLHSLR